MLVFLGFRGGSDGKESICNAGDLGSIPAFYLYFSKPKSQSIYSISIISYLRGGPGSPLQYSCLENLHGQRSLMDYSPRGHKESDTTKP